VPDDLPDLGPDPLARAGFGQRAQAPAPSQFPTVEYTDQDSVRPQGVRDHRDLRCGDRYQVLGELPRDQPSEPGLPEPPEQRDRRVLDRADRPSLGREKRLGHLRELVAEGRGATRVSLPSYLRPESAGGPALGEPGPVIGNDGARLLDGDVHRIVRDTVVLLSLPAPSRATAVRCPRSAVPSWYARDGGTLRCRPVSRCR